MTAKEMRDELRALRKEHIKPVSRMRVTDVSAEIQRLKVAREETPAAAQTRKPKVSAVTESVAEVKSEQFPVPAKKTPKVPKAKVPEPLVAPVPEKKGRPAKGSEEAKAHMAKIRNTRKKAE